MTVDEVLRWRAHFKQVLLFQTINDTRLTLGYLLICFACFPMQAETICWSHFLWGGISWCNCTTTNHDVDDRCRHSLIIWYSSCYMTFLKKLWSSFNVTLIIVRRFLCSDYWCLLLLLCCDQCWNLFFLLGYFNFIHVYPLCPDSAYWFDLEFFIRDFYVFVDEFGQPLRLL